MTKFPEPVKKSKEKPLVIVDNLSKFSPDSRSAIIDLNRLTVNITELRMFLAGMGLEKLGLGDLLSILPSYFVRDNEKI